MRDFRFGFNVFEVRSREEFAAYCRRAEEFGYDVALMPDHLGAPAPFPTLVAAAEATERLRVGTFVLNAAFWNPHLLAREIATTDRLTGGRLEVGLGAGHMKWEFDAAGLPWRPFGERVEHLERTIEEMAGAFGGPGYPEQEPLRSQYGMEVLRPVQRHGFGGHGPPLLVGGTGDTVLRLAARHADIVGLAGTHQVKGQPPGTFTIGTAEHAAERVAFIREHAGDRDPELNLMVQFVVVTDDRRGTAAQVAERLPNLSVEEVLETPYLLIGTVEQMAERLRENRERYGFTYITVQGPFLDAFAPVIGHLR
ncbi:LLM class F420-dependent oxidoreductase [Actinomadura kijaniata]|uniref:LLM class F420-dependent oxidoreductase n=1 Tax=Actinomadura kijaniata TaxID=46161 RepID=UPI00082B4E46|nr:LLM class F420-dependent oxidoreductase [Actinomadura kijaniata]